MVQMASKIVTLIQELKNNYDQEKKSFNRLDQAHKFQQNMKESLKWMLRLPAHRVQVTL
jgi:beta-lactamase class D